MRTIEIKLKIDDFLLVFRKNYLLFSIRRFNRLDFEIYSSENK